GDADDCGRMAVGIGDRAEAQRVVAGLARSDQPAAEGRAEHFNLVFEWKALVHSLKLVLWGKMWRSFSCPAREPRLNVPVRNGLCGFVIAAGVAYGTSANAGASRRHLPFFATRARAALTDGALRAMANVIVVGSQWGD